MHTHTQTRTLAPPEEIIKQATSRHKEKNKRDIRALLARIPITDGVTKIVAVVTFSSLWLLLLLVRSHVSPDPKDLVTTSFVGLAALLQQGAVSGRDFLSNYGLAAQIWAWMATMLTSTKSALNAYAMISFFLGMASAVLIAAVLLICDRISWRECGIVYLFGAVLNLFLDVPNFTSAVLLLIAAFAYRIVRAATVRRQIAWAASTGLLCFVAQLITFQMVIYGVVVVVGTLVAGSILRRDSAVLLMIKVFVAVLALANLGLVVWFRFTSSNYGLLFDYQGYALEMMRAFSMSMGLLWELPGMNTIVLGLVALYVIVMCVRAAWNSEPLHACLLLSFLLASVVSLNGALVRSDISHIAQAFSPFVFLFLVIAWSEWKTRNGLLLWILFAMGLLVAWPTVGFSAPADLLKLFRGEVSIKRVARDLSRTSKPLALLPASVLTPENKNRSDRPLLAFPQETFIGVGLKRSLVSPILESQSAATEPLQRYYVDSLEKQRSAHADLVYGLETEDFSPIDGVQAITRTPRIFEYLYRNYELAGSEEHRDGHYVLHARREPRAVVYEDLPFTAPRQMAGSGMLKLEAPSTCGIVRVEMNLRFKRNPYLFRPSGIELNFNDGDQTIWRGLVRPLEINKPFTTYISLVERQAFHNVFGSSPIQNRKWDHVEYHPLNAEALGAEATRIEVAHLQCLNPETFTLPVQPDGALPEELTYPR